MDESTTATRHLVTLTCNGQTRQGWLTGDEAEQLWTYAKTLCLPVTTLRNWAPLSADVSLRWAKTGRDLPEGISVVATEKE